MAYKVTLETDRLRLIPKGRRKGGIELTWEELLTVADSEATGPVISEAPAVPRVVLAEVAEDVRTAASALTRADGALAQAAGLPASLRAEIAADPVHGRVPEREDWFVEPLLTVTEVASILRVSTRAVRRLSIKAVSISGEVRYRQSEIRRFLRQQEAPISVR